MGRIFYRTKKDGSKSLYISVYDPARLFAVPECIKSGKLKDAEKRIREIENQKDDGEEINHPKRKKTTMVELLELVRSDYKTNGKKDLYSLELRLDNHLIPFFRQNRASAVNAERIKEFTKEKLAEGLKPATVNRMLSHLSYAFKLGFELKKISQIPLIKTLRENNRRKGFFERAEFQKVYAHLPEPVKPIAELGYFSGMREGELLGLQWSQVDVVRGVIRLEETKADEPREIHYSEIPEIKSLIDTQYERKLQSEFNIGKKIEHLFFRYSTGKPILDFRVAWKRACEKAGVNRIFHDLRRTACRNLIAAGVPESVAMMISGHKTRSMLERYNIVNPEQTRKALAKVSLVNFENLNENSEPFEPPAKVQ